MTNPFIFFNLPLELRREIYRELLTGAHQISNPSPADGFSALDFYDFSETILKHPRRIMDTAWADRKQEEDEGEAEEKCTPDFTILRVSRQIYEEASQILYGESLFVAHYRVSQLNSLKYPYLGDLGALTVNLPRVRKLIINIRDDRFNTNHTSKGIKEILQFYANNAKSLWYLQVNLRFGGSPTPGESNTIVSELLEDPEMPQVFETLAVRNEISIEVTPDENTSTDEFEKLALCVAEQRDWLIYKYHDKDEDNDMTFPSPRHVYTTSWFIVPGGRMPLEAGLFTGPDMRHLPVSGRIVDFTQYARTAPSNDRDSQD